MFRLDAGLVDADRNPHKDDAECKLNIFQRVQILRIGAC
jgi:hypothetical protein